MSTPDPEGFSLAAKVIAAITAVVSPFVVGYSWINGRLEKKADKDEVDRHRDYFAKIFDELRKHEERDADRFAELQQIISDNQADILRELGRKEDR